MKRCHLLTLFLCTIATSVFFLAIYFTFARLYTLKVLHLMNRITHARSEVQKQQPHRTPDFSVLQNFSLEDGAYNVTTSPNHPKNVSMGIHHQGRYLETTGDEDSEVSTFFLTKAGLSKLTSDSHSRRNTNVSGDENMESFHRNEDQTILHSDEKARSTKVESQFNSQNGEKQFLPDPHKRYLIRRFTGRFGNVLFEFATAFCIAMLNNLTLIVEDVKELQDLRYDGIRVQDKVWKQVLSLPFKHHNPLTCCGFDSNVMRLEPANFSHALHGYTQSWKYFEPCKTEVKRAIRFKQNIITKAINILSYLRKKLPHRTLVGVHVRMEDYLHVQAQKNGKKVAPPDYYHRAMTYFRSHFRDVIFVVIASDPTFFKTNVTHAPDVFFLNRSDSPAVDMEVMSRMDHIIFSVGTFGWWIGYKNKGTVVCFKDFYVPDSKYGRQMWNNAEDFLYPGWISL